MTHPAAAGDRDAFVAGLTAGRPQVWVRRIVDDLETPVSAFLKVAHGRSNTLLLESVEGGETRGRYSILAMDPDLIWRARGAEAELCVDPHGPTPRFETDPVGSTVASLRSLLDRSRFDLPADLPPMGAGLFGVFGYDTVRLLEPLGEAKPDPLDLPDAVLMRPQLVAIFDSVAHQIILVGTIHPRDGLDPSQALEDTVARMDAFEAALEQAAPRTGDQPVSIPGVETPVDQAAFAAAIDAAKAYIAAGDIFQVVLSHRMSVPWSRDPFEVYRALRRINPSPYLFHLDFGGFQLSGSSPEILVRLKAGRVTIRPLAGTRPRGSTPDQDAALETELLADPKERAEHLMLLDLGRNDVGRVSAPGSVRVTDSFAVERYSQVMHIVSNVEGEAKADLDAVDAILAALPAGTLSGAPKVRAMQIIDTLEDHKRGVGYGGGVGYIASNGEADLCIVLRTVLFTKGRAFVQAGAGVVADSDAAAEYRETLAKAAAPLKALAEARPIVWRGLGDQ